MEHDNLDGIRIRVKSGNDNYYFSMMGQPLLEIICSYPDPNNREKQNEYASFDTVTRLVSVSLQKGVPLEKVEKQLMESSRVRGDTPSLVLSAIKKYKEGLQ